MPYVNVKVTQYKEPIVLRHPIKVSPIKVETAVPLSEYWKLLGISFLQERFMKFSTIYIETAAELIEVSECASFDSHVLHHLLGGFQMGTLFVCIIPKEEPVFYK